MLYISKNKENPEERRERLRQEELKRNLSGSIHGGGLPDVVGNLRWKGTIILIIILILAFTVYSIFF